MMKKQPTTTQQKLIDNGAATRTLTIRYESTGSWGAPTRRETVKTTLPDLGDGHATFRAGRDTYIIANNAIYVAQTRNINESHWGRQADELHETFYMGAKDKAEAVSEAYDNEYSNSVVVNGCVSQLIDKTLYAHLMGDGRMYVVDDLDTDLGDYIDGEYVRVTSQKIGSWRVPLIHAAKLRDAYRQRMNNYGVDGDLAGDETANIPFNDEAVAAALAANAEGAQWGVDTGVYVPTIQEMDAADALGGAFRGVESGYGKVNSLATARRIADALAAYDAARENVTIL
jgi:hypothetical protein